MAPPLHLSPTDWLDLFGHYLEHPDELPAEWSHTVVSEEESGRLRGIADFIAGMTDRYALAEHARLFSSTPKLI